MQNLIDKANAITDIIHKLNGLWISKKTNEHKILASIPNRIISDVSNTTINGIKNSFGQLFYGALCPINGVSPKNKRFSDAGNEYEKSVSGNCVWKEIGFLNRWSSRASWYNKNQLFDKLKLEHIDLVINGIRNRKDQIAVAKELFLIREKIREQLSFVDEKKDNKLSVTLSQSYIVQMVLANKKLAELEIPYFYLDINVSDIIINDSYMEIPIKPNKADASLLFNKFNIDVTSYQFTSYITVPLLQVMDEIPKASITWGEEYYIFGISALVQDSSIDKIFDNMFSAKKKAIEILEKAQTKYSGRMLANGLL